MTMDKKELKKLEDKVDSIVSERYQIALLTVTELHEENQKLRARLAIVMEAIPSSHMLMEAAQALKDDKQMHSLVSYLVTRSAAIDQALK